MKTVAFCEIDPFCRKVLRKHWPDVPIYEDVRTLDYDGPVDVICGGYPCQPFSHAGKRQGAEDDRHLWPAMFEVIQTHRPTWVIGENVAGHISMGLDQVLSDLEAEDYAVQTFVIPACAVDAPHRRERVWIVAYADGTRHNRTKEPGICEAEISEGLSNHAGDAHPDVPNANKQGPQGRNGEELSECASERIAGESSSSVAHTQEQRNSSGGDNESGGKHNQSQRESGGGGLRSGRQASIWRPEPGVGRVANGVPRRVDRLKSLGNAVVPQIPEIIGRAIMEAQ